MPPDAPSDAPPASASQVRPPRSVLLAGYLALSRAAPCLARRVLMRRLHEAKEDPARVSERMGQASVERPEGRLAWFTASSVGEAVSLLELLRRIGRERPDLTCLVTTVTTTSAEHLAPRLPPRCLHQFAPVDVLPWVGRFLDHWRPDLAVWTESELWPATLTETHRRGIPMLLLNARISERSFRRWRAARGMARGLLARFDRILAQDDLAAEQLTALGAQGVTVMGTLKEGAAPLEHDEAERVRLGRAFAGRPLWLAASTHDGEEAIVSRVLREARKALPMLVLVLAPRHPVRGDELAKTLRAEGWAVAQRSKSEAPGPEVDIYLADTLGEMGLWYRMASVAFVGGSLTPVGGHNPFEPALLGCAIIHGPHVRNFAEAYARLAGAGAAVRVADEAELAPAVVNVMAPDCAASMAAAGWDAVSEGASVTDAVLDVVGSILDRSAPAPAG
jgi:3-deoxy-D-manno-octulosonic-acid transferase